MSSMKTLHNSKVLENKGINCDKLLRSRQKIILKPIKTNIPFSAKKFFTMEAKSKEEPLIVKEDEKIIKNNNYINYLNNIKGFNQKNKYYSLNTSKSNNSIISSKNKEKSPLKINISDKISFIHKGEGHKNSQYIKLNSLFNLPPIGKAINRYNSFKSFNNSNSNNEVEEDNNQVKHSQLIKKSKIRNYHKKIRLNLFNNEQLSKIKMRNRTRKKLEDSQFENLSNFMKFKYYEDVNEKMERKLRDDYFIDRGVKDKIIDMGKIGIFWKNVLDYCSPLLYAEKYKNMQKYEKKNEENTLNNSKNYKKYNQKLYTSILRAKLIHFKKNKII